MHLVGFIIRIYHAARSPERQIPELLLHSPVISVASRYISNKGNFTYLRISMALQTSVVHDSPFCGFMYLVCRHYFNCDLTQY